MISLDELLVKAAPNVLNAAPPDAIMYRTFVAAGIARHEWSRTVDGVVRYLRITPIKESRDPSISYEVLGGTYPKDCTVNAPAFDGRRVGNLDFMLRFLRHWLVDWEDWTKFEPVPPAAR